VIEYVSAKSIAISIRKIFSRGDSSVGIGTPPCHFIDNWQPAALARVAIEVGNGFGRRARKPAVPVVPIFGGLGVCFRFERQRCACRSRVNSGG
jgi:hypothetical protein